MSYFLQVYPEQLIGRITKKSLSTIDMTDAEFFEQVGLFFVEFVSQFGYYIVQQSNGYFFLSQYSLFVFRYGDVLALLGRQLRDFLNGLDNLHEYLKYSYPRFSVHLLD